MRPTVRFVSLATLVLSLAAFAAEPGSGTPPPNPQSAPPPNPAAPPNPHAGMGGPGGPHGMGMPGMQMAPPPAAKLTPEDIKNIFYGIGASVGKGVGDAFGPSKEEWTELLKGLDEQVAGKPQKFTIEEMQPKVRALEGQRREERHQAALKKNEELLAKYAAEPGVEKLPSGVLITHTTPGTGEKPKPTDTVSVNYRGTTPDGNEFDSSYKRNKPAEFPLNRVIKCWTEGVGAMKVGEKAKLVCPSDLAYGQNAPPGSGIPANSVLIFEVELLSIKAPTPPPGTATATPPAPAATATDKPKPAGGCSSVPGLLGLFGLLPLLRRRRA